ncbi:hypothetical protein V4U86_17455 [Mycobacterium sp. AMU20-3851]|uniref:hypothetical protein n=1 Tax=Mycobacterium sp. AMU20-3851 TaxID=3122055 RepID=UPI003754D15B
MTPEPLKVDAELLRSAGERLLTAAQGLPDAPEAFSVPCGADALSQAIALEIPKAENPIIEGLPPMKQNAIGTAESVIEAARRYANTDSRLKSKIDETMRPPGAGAGGPGGAGGSGGGPAASGGPAGSGGPGGGSVGGAPAGGAPMSPGAASAVPASASAGSAGQLGSMLGMPMQMAQQAAQIPSQAAGMAGSLPQSAMQGAQQVGEQVTQMVGQFSEKDGRDEESEPSERGGRHRAEEPDGAASGDTNAERAPAAPSVPRSAAHTDPTINL